MRELINRHRYPLLLMVLCAIAFIPFLGRVHLFDWDEINFAEISREMTVLGDYLRIHVNFEPFWEKPPFFFWMQVLAMKSFGIGAFAARLPNALCGIATILILYLMGRKLVSKRFGLLWGAAYFGSILPHFYFKTGIIDPWFNLFIFCGLYFFVLLTRSSGALKGGQSFARTHRYLLLAGLSIGMAILTKGQVAYLVFCLCVGLYWAVNKFRLPVSIPQFLMLTLIAALVTLTWYGLETLKNGPWFVTEFTRYQYILFSTPSAGHDGFPGYHFVVNWFGCFPASILALPMLFGRKMPSVRSEDFRKWMIILFWVVIILFSIVESKIVHYSSLVYFPLTFLAASTVDALASGRLQLSRGLRWALGVTGGLIGLVITVIPLVGQNLQELASHISDPFAAANLKAEVTWSVWESMIGLVFLTGLIVAIRMMSRERFRRGFFVLSATVAVTVWAITYQFIPKVERYTQGAAIDFLKSIADEDCYVDVLGYKSYAHYFYTRKPPPQPGQQITRDWLLTGSLDKPAYFVTKINKLDAYADSPGIQVLYEKNGFVFLKRE